MIDPDIELASFQIGYRYPMDTLSVFEGRVVQLESGKYFIPKFIGFQYGTLSTDCRAHGPVFQSLLKNDINATNLHYKGYPKGIDTLQDKDKDKDKDKEKEKDKDKEPKKSKSRGTIDEIKAFVIELGLPESDGEATFHKWDGNGWMNGKAPIVNWKSTIRSWKAAGYMPSQKSPAQAGFTTKPKFAGMQEDLEIPDA